MKEITQKIIGCAYNVLNNLGHGFMEKLYENALMLELEYIGLKAAHQVPISVSYRNKVIGNYIADIVVENKIIVELKVVSELSKIHAAQVINYIKATKYPVALLFNFSKPKLEFRRFEY